MSWDKALDLPGATQVGFLPKLFVKLPWQEMLVSTKVFAGLKWPLHPQKLALTTVDQGCILIYQPRGSKIKTRINKMEKLKPSRGGFQTLFRHRIGFKIGYY